MPTSSETSREEIKRLIHEVEQTIILTLNPERRLNLIELSRAVDYYFIGRHYNQNWANSKEVEDFSQQIAYGLHKALSLTLDESSKYQGAPLFQSTDKLQKWSDSVLQICGLLGYCEGLLELQRVGLIELSKVDTNHYYARPIAKPFGAESYERENITWVKNYLAFSQRGYHAYLNKKRRGIEIAMSRNVETWMTYYIQYNSTPEIDEFFELEGRAIVLLMLGNDSFPATAKFGGVEFGVYCAALATLAGWANKHIGFCFELLKKHPNIKPRNIFTITAPIEDKIRWLSIALEVDPLISRQIIENLTLTFENKKEHCSVAGNLITPTFVEIGDGKLLCPLWGRLSEPFLFLLRELRRRYRKDWDTAVNSREQIFRDDLYAFFSSNRFLKLSRNANLKTSSVLVTDIDALILDRQTGVMGIFQLKWQDFIGNSMKERESKKGNILSTGNQWVERVSNWLVNADNKTIAQTFDLNKDDSACLKEFRLFMLGRNSIFFSGSGEPDQRAAWGQWYQLVRIIKGLPSYENPLDYLFTTLQEDAPINKPLPTLSLQEISVGNITISVGN